MKYLIFILLFLNAKFCEAQNYFSKLETKSQFQKLQGEPLLISYGSTQSVKVVLRLKDTSIYYIKSGEYKYHFDFCVRELKCRQDISVFNKKNYTDSSNRDFLLCNLNYVSHVGYYIDFVPEDNISQNDLYLLYKKIAATVYFTDSILVLANNPNLWRNKNAEIKKITATDIFSKQVYQCVVAGNTKAKLRFIEDIKKEYSTISVNDIIVIHGTPLQIPNCAGIITDALQTPLSHVNVMANSKQIPAIACKNVWQNPYVLSLNNQYVDFVSKLDTFSITVINEKEINTKSINTKKKKYKFNIKAKNLVDLKQATLLNKYAIGNKAFNFSKLYVVQKRSPNLFEVPEKAFAIPVYYYYNHLQQNQIQNEIAKLLNIQNIDSLKTQLKKIRQKIKNTNLNKNLLKAVNKKLKQMPNAAFRFRSSANAEDDESFSAAGLFESYTGKLNDTNKTVEQAIKKVWASVWTYEAYSEIVNNGIDINTVMMGILVHGSFPDEEANGVVISKNLYRKDYPGFTVNVQIGDISVVSPDSGIYCDQLIVMSDVDFTNVTDKVVTQYISLGNQNQGLPILTQEQATILYRAISAIKEYFYYSEYLEQNSFADTDYFNFGLDLEFKFDEGKLFIKQVRGYR